MIETLKKQETIMHSDIKNDLKKFVNTAPVFGSVGQFTNVKVIFRYHICAAGDQCL